MKKSLGLRLDEKLIERIDEARGETPRTQWIEKALEQKLDLELEPRVYMEPPDRPMTKEELKKIDPRLAVERVEQEPEEPRRASPPERVDEAEVHPDAPSAPAEPRYQCPRHPGKTFGSANARCWCNRKVVPA